MAVIDNRNIGNDADVLALRVAGGGAGGSNNFITCFSGGAAIGAIEGNGAGISFNTTSADYAEWLPRDDGEPAMQPGDLVGVFAGRLRRETAGADYLLIISTAPAMLANMPSAEERDRHERVAMLGQAPVRVRGAVKAGDVIVPSGSNDGTGVAVPAADTTVDDFAMSVGTAWSSATGKGVSLVRCAIGLVSAGAWRSVARALVPTRSAPTATDAGTGRAPAARRSKSKA